MLCMIPDILLTFINSNSLNISVFPQLVVCDAVVYIVIFQPNVVFAIPQTWHQQTTTKNYSVGVFVPYLFNSSEVRSKNADPIKSS